MTAKIIKKTGLAAELILAAEILSRGGIPSFPYGNASTYDLIVDFPEHPLKRVQVKTTSSIEMKVRHTIKSSKKGPYKRNAFDVLAVLYNSNWYFFEWNTLFKPNSVNLYLGPKHATAQNAWHILGDPDAGSSNSVSTSDPIPSSGVVSTISDGISGE
jgi:hypothetical protein